MQDKPKFTPGPWIRSIHGFQVLTHDRESSICELKEAKNESEQIANANLIASALEMHKALEQILDCEEHFYTEQGGIRLPKQLSPWSGPISVIFSITREALRKAQGGETKPLPTKPHDCDPNDLSLVKEFYSRTSTYSHESLRIYRCSRCGQLWKIRAQFDDGTGDDNIWLKPGQSERGYEFTMAEAETIGNTQGGEVL